MRAPSPLESAAAAGGAGGVGGAGGGRRVLELGAEIPSRKARTYSELCFFLSSSLALGWPLRRRARATQKEGEGQKNG